MVLTVDAEIDIHELTTVNYRALEKIFLFYVNRAITQGNSLSL